MLGANFHKATARYNDEFDKDLQLEQYFTEDSHLFIEFTSLMISAAGCIGNDGYYNLSPYYTEP